jgi:hypothetical protein
MQLILQPPLRVIDDVGADVVVMVFVLEDGFEIIALPNGQATRFA